MLGVLVLLGGTAAALGANGHGPFASMAGSTSSASSAPSTPAPASSPSAAKSSSAPKPSASTQHAVLSAAQQATARKQIAAVAAKQPSGAVSVAVTDLASGRRFSTGATHGMRTASVYKLFVLETLLRRAHGPLSGSQASLATRMIENSDNVAGYALYEDAGCSGLHSMASRLHMKHTEIPCNDPTFTTTSASDFQAVLTALVKPGTLTASARSYAKHLMANVEPDQRWGVGAAASKGATFYNKNGWLSIDNSNPAGERDDGLWAVTSVGIVPVAGRTLLMAVFTQHQPSMGAGVKLIERLAKITAAAAVG